MAKMKFVSPQQYATHLSQVIQSTEDAGNKVAPFFEELDDAIMADQVADMPKADFKKFQLNLMRQWQCTRMHQLRLTPWLHPFV